MARPERPERNRAARSFPSLGDSITSSTRIRFSVHTLKRSTVATRAGWNETPQFMPDVMPGTYLPINATSRKILDHRKIWCPCLHRCLLASAGEVTTQRQSLGGQLNEK